MIIRDEKVARGALRGLHLHHLARRVVLSLGAMGSYILLFALLEPAIGSAAVTLSVLPVVAVGLLLGLVGGVLAGVLFLPLNTLLLNLSEHPDSALLLKGAGLPVSSVLVVVGAMVGRLSDVHQKLEHEKRRLQREIIEREQTEERLKESEGLYRAVVENVADGIVIVSGNERVFVNAAYLNLYGLTDVSQAIGSPPDELIHPDDRERVRERILSLERGSLTPWRHEYRIRRPNGEVRTVQTSSVPITYKGSSAGLAVIRDITNQKRAEEAERLRSQELESLLNIANQLVQPGSFEQKCNSVLEELAQVAQADSVMLWLYDQGQERYCSVASAGADTDTPPPAYLGGPKEQATTPAIHNSQSILAEVSITAAEDSASSDEQGSGSTLELPVHIGGDHLGIITINSRYNNHFTPERVRLVTAVANGIGALLENAKLYQEKSSQLEQGRRRLEAFQAAVSRLALARIPEEAMQTLVDTTRELLKARYGALVLWNDEGHIETWVISGVSPEEKPAIGGTPWGLGLLSLVRDEEKSVRLNYIPVPSEDSRLPPDHPPMKTFLGVPIVFQGRSTGAFYLTDREDNAEFTQEDEQLLNVFAVLAGVHLENAKLYEEVTRERGTFKWTPSSGQR